MTSKTVPANIFTISNIAGGGSGTFRLVRGDLSQSAIKRARDIGYGGPEFDGPAGPEAFRLWNAAEEARMDANDY